jgi:uncharacterized membrane protein
MLACVGMGELNSLETPSLQVRIGRLFFALAVLGSGILQLVMGHFVRLLPVHPGRLPPVWLAYLFGVLLALIGFALLVRRVVSFAALAIAMILLVLFLGFGLPVALAHPWAGFGWTDPLMMLALIGGAFLAGAPREGSPGSSLDRFFEKATRFVPLLLGAFLAYCGMAHFLAAADVASMIPSWIPAHMFCTYFAGVALIAGGVGVLVPRTARLAATMSGIMVFSWVFLVHIPLAVDKHSISESAGVFEALGVSGVAFMLAGALRIHNPRSMEPMAGELVRKPAM